MRRKRKYIIAFSLFLFISILFFVLISRPKEMKIKFIQNKTGYYTEINYNRVKANKYKLFVKNTSKLTMFEKEITNELVKLDLLYPNYGDIYVITVLAYDEDNKAISQSNEVDFLWDTPTFDRTGDYIISKTKGRSLKINGEINTNYSIVYKYDKKQIASSLIRNNQTIYPEKVFSYDKQKVTAYIMDGDSIIDKKNLYVNTERISPVKITDPLANKEYVVDNYHIKFTGGENANKYELTIREGDIDIYKTTIRGSKHFYVKSNLFKPNKAYIFIVKAQYNDYYELEQKHELGIITRNTDYVWPVHTNRHFLVNYGEKIELGNVLQNVKVIYTTDGSKPSESNGRIYQEPITINTNMEIKAIAINSYGVKSIISTFNYKIDKKDIIIYLSPSSQPGNLGHRKTPYTNEREIMNRLTDILEPMLKEKGFIIYRNNPVKEDIMKFIHESRSAKADLHMPIHSNGSRNHNVSGIKVYIDSETMPSYSLANLVQQDLVSIYYNKLNPNSRVTYSKGSLGEARPANIPFGIFLEIGYHDDYYDAMWLVNNLEEIAESLTRSLVKYFGY